MDRYSNFADSSEAADLPWDAYFDAVLPRSGSSENIPSVNTSHSPSPFSAVQDDDITTPLTHLIVVILSM